MEAPREKLPQFLLFTLCSSVVLLVIGWIGKALEPFVFSPDTWGSALKGIQWFAGEVSKVTTSLWFLLPAATVFGAWLGVGIGRSIQILDDAERKKRATHESTWVAFPPPPPPPSPPPSPVIDPVKLDLNRRQAIDEFRVMQAELSHIMSNSYRDDGQRFREFKARGSAIDAFYVTMKKAGFMMPKLYERSLFEYAGLVSYLNDIKPFIESRHWDEGIERGKDHATQLEKLYSERHEKAKAERETRT